MKPIRPLRMRSGLTASGAVAYRYYRLHMTLATGGGVHLALGELELYETSGGTNFATSATATASSFGFGLPAANINDADVFNIWHAADITVPQWVLLDLGAGNETALHSYKIYCRDGREDQAPADWTLEASNDGSSWTTLDPQSGWDATMWGTPPRGALPSWQLFTI